MSEVDLKLRQVAEYYYNYHFGTTCSIHIKTLFLGTVTRWSKEQSYIQTKQTVIWWLHKYQQLLMI